MADPVVGGAQFVPPRHRDLDRSLPESSARLPSGARPLPLWSSPAKPAVRGGVVFIGDSQTAGLAVAMNDLYGHRDNFGYGPSYSKGATCTLQWGGSWHNRRVHQTERLNAALGTEPRVVVVALGTNDGLNLAEIHGAEHERYVRNLRKDVATIVGRIRESGATPVWALPPHTDVSSASVDLARNVIREELVRAGVSYAEPPPRGPGMLLDGVHAGWPEGFDAMATKVWRAMPRRQATLPSTEALALISGGAAPASALRLPVPPGRSV